MTRSALAAARALRYHAARERRAQVNGRRKSGEHRHDHGAGHDDKEQSQPRQGSRQYDGVHFPTFISTRKNGGSPGLRSFSTDSMACMGSGFIQ
jgi:hypothetical protein